MTWYRLVSIIFGFWWLVFLPEDLLIVYLVFVFVGFYIHVFVFCVPLGIMNYGRSGGVSFGTADAPQGPKFWLEPGYRAKLHFVRDRESCRGQGVRGGQPTTGRAHRELC
ncbi:hypothetical protein GBAR_LOCUS7747 [Geodia barretti]|uniref:Transmembrane protein n=1 Tax=Geodia barretti TaxID=519541 RepID=A0AA35RKP2_GEOBA|nr:hypothetical protein GBAR_LOCUS7747 [Geodia barretti]